MLANSTQIPATHIPAPKRPIEGRSICIPLAGNEHLAVKGIEVEPTSEPISSVVKKTFSVVTRNAAGESMGEPQRRTIPYRVEQDVVDVLAYCRDGDRFLIAVTENLRPVMALRPHLTAAPFSAVMKNLPGSYIRNLQGEFGIEQAVDEVLRTKLGLERVSESRALGGSYHPESTSPELVFPRSVEVHRPADLDPQLVLGETFARSRVNYFLEPQEIVDQFLAGKLNDLRLFELTLRFAEQMGIKLKFPQLVSSPTNLRADVSLACPVLTREQLPRVADLFPAVGDHMELQELAPQEGADAYIRSVNAAAQNISPADAPMESAPYSVDAVYHEGVDCHGIGTYFVQNGEIYMVVNIGCRAAFKARDAVAHPIHSDVTGRSVEGTFISFAHLPARSDAQELTDGFAKHLGFAATSPAVPLNAYAAPSPGFNPELWHLSLLEIDPRRRTSLNPEAQTFFMRASDIVALGETGEIKSLGLLTLARIVLAARAGQTAVLDNEENHGRVRLQSIINKGSPLLKDIFEISPNRYRILSESPVLRRQVNYLANEYGVRFHQFSHPSERNFFSPFIGEFSSDSVSDRDGLGELAHHDFDHYAIGDFIPIRDANGQLCSYEVYRHALLAAESEALLSSEVIRPRMLGAAYPMSTMSLGAVFEAVGIVGRENERSAIRSMVIDGVVPDELILHPRYEELAPVIREKLIGYYIRDGENTRRLYERWCAHQKVAEVAPKFFDRVYTDPKKFEDSLVHAHEPFERYAEGLNPIKSELARVRFQEIGRLALTLAYLYSEIEKWRSEGAEWAMRDIQEVIDSLEIASKELARYQDSIKNIEFSQINLEAVEAAERIEQTIVSRAESIANRCMQQHSDLLSPYIGEKARGKRYPFFIPLDFELPKEAESQIKELEARSRSAARNRKVGAA